MKISKIIALITAIIFALVCSFSVSATNPMANDVLYVDTNTKAYNSSTGASYKQPSGTAHAFLTVKEYNNNPCYCIEFGAKFTRTRYKGVNLSNSAYWSSLSAVKREGIALMSAFGYPAQSISELGVNSADDAYIATQSLITEYQTGIRTSPTNLTDLKYYNTIKGTPAETAYNHILADANEYISSSQYDGKTDELPGFVNFTSESGSEEQELICFYGTMPQVLSTGYIEIYKKNPDGVLLDGAEFKIYNSNGNYVTDIGPTINGYAKSNEISFGTYTVVETKAPENYERGEQNQWTVTLDSDHVSVALDVINKHKSGFLKVIKTAEDQIVADCEFSLTGIDVYGRPVNMTAKTNNSGIAIFEDVPIGTGYELEEKSPPDRYLIPDKQTVDIKGDETVVVNIFNVLKKQYLKIQKCDTETGKTISLSGIGFKVKNTETGDFITQHTDSPISTDVDVFFTDESGTVTLPEKLSYGKYEIIEQCTADGYVLDKTPVEFMVDGRTEIITVTINNIAQKGVIKVRKTGEVFSSVTRYNGQYVPFYKVEFLADAVFEITAAEDIITPDGTVRYQKGEVVDRVTTTKYGDSTSKALYLGKYIVKEVKAPVGMVIDSEPKFVELIYTGQEVEITESVCSSFNERQKLKIRLTKELEKAFGLGEKELENVYFALYSAKDIVAADGSMIPNGATIEIAQCDKNGNIIFKTDLPVGSKVYVKEYSTDTHYQISDETYYVDFIYSGQETKEIDVFLNDGKPIKNELLRGKVIVKKIDKEGNALSGVTFGLFKKEETEFSEKTALAISISGEDGMFSFDNVPYGEWIISELKSADGYILADKNTKVNINAENPVVEITVINEKITESPKTGHDGKIWGSLIAMLVSGVAVVALISKNKKGRKN